MDDGIKQRLIGAVVLVTAAVIFVPMVFDRPDEGPEQILADIPPKPEIPKLNIEPAKPPPPPEEEVVTPEVAEAEAKAITEKALEKPKEVLFDKTRMPVSWTLQLAAFADANNAEKLRDRLRKAGHRAYLQSKRDQNPPLVRVFVGPELERGKVDALKAKLEKEFKLNGRVVRYAP